MIGETVNGKGVKVYKADNWRKYIDQCQHNMLVQGYSKCMLVLTDTLDNIYIIDIIADANWQRETIFFAEFEAALSKVINPNRYQVRDTALVCPSYEKSMLSSRMLDPSSLFASFTNRVSSTKKTTCCNARITLRYVDEKHKPRGFSYIPATNGIYVTTLDNCHTGCLSAGDTETHLDTSEREILAASFLRQQQLFKIKINSLILQTATEMNKVITRQQAANLIRKGLTQQRKERNTDGMSDHDRYMLGLDQSHDTSYVARITERDEATDKELRRFIVIKVAEV